MRTITVHAHPNISLIKYWGKRDEKLMLPTKSSITISLSSLETITSVRLNNSDKDEINIGWLWNNNKQASIHPILEYLNFFRKKYAINKFFTVDTHNNFPTQAGLASSSSGFAALAMGLNALCDLKLNTQELSILARQGSGSACRSVCGGFVLWNKGIHPDGSDCYAEQVFSPGHWPEIRILIAIVNKERKPVSSRAGMQLTTSTSPFYSQWIKESEQRIEKIIHAIKNKNMEQVGLLAEADWEGMLETMLTTTPKLDYRTQATHDVITMIKKIRKEKNIQAYFTTEAGPNVKIICFEQDTKTISSRLKELESVTDVIECSVAQDPQIIETHE